jgi:hypothetical membrane protein
VSDRQYGTIGIVGVSVFLLANVALHFLDPDLSVVDTVLSDYGLGDYGWLSRAGDIAAAVGLIAIALGLRSTLAPGKRVAASWALILIAGFGFIVSALFVTDGTEATEFTTTGVLHIVSSLVAILGLIVTAWLLRGVFSRDDGYRHLSRTELWFAILISVTAVAMILLAGTADGLAQRALVIVMVAWWLVLAVNVRQSTTLPRGSEPGAPT